MKTLKLQFATLAAIFAFFISFSANANCPSLSEETYIEDIPFNTETIADNFSMNMIETEFDFEGEYEIYDIPFNTACVTAGCRYEIALAEEFEMEDEAYINDIPFNTKEIVRTGGQVDFEEETYIDDIPFSTFKVANQVEYQLYANNK